MKKETYKKELYSEEEIMQAMLNVLLREGKVYLDLVLLELKKLRDLTP